MKTIEGKKVTVKKYTLELTELDIEILLKALGAMQHHQYDTGMSSKTTEVMINKIYRAMGVKL